MLLTCPVNLAHVLGLSLCFVSRIEGCCAVTDVTCMPAGSVCILGAATAEAELAVQRIVSKYAEETGFVPYEFRGTSIGASRFDHLRLTRQIL